MRCSKGKGRTMFSVLFIGGVIGFLIVYGIILVWQERRIRRLEEGEWKVGVPTRRRNSKWHTR